MESLNRRRTIPEPSPEQMINNLMSMTDALQNVSSMSRGRLVVFSCTAVTVAFLTCIACLAYLLSEMDGVQDLIELFIDKTLEKKNNSSNSV